MKYKQLDKPNVGDVFHHTTANGWYEEALVISVQTWGEVWKALLMTSSEGTVFLGTGSTVRDNNDWAPKVESTANVAPAKQKRMKQNVTGNA